MSETAETEAEAAEAVPTGEAPPPETALEPAPEPAPGPAPAPAEGGSTGPAEEVDSATLVAEAKHFAKIALARIDAIPAGVEHGLASLADALRGTPGVGK